MCTNIRVCVHLQVYMYVYIFTIYPSWIRIYYINVLTSSVRQVLIYIYIHIYIYTPPIHTHITVLE